LPNNNESATVPFSKKIRQLNQALQLHYSEEQRIEPRAGRTGPGDPGASLPRGGAADPATSSISAPGLRHVIILSRHHAWRGIGVSPRHDNRRGKKC